MVLFCLARRIEPVCHCVRNDCGLHAVNAIAPGAPLVDSAIPVTVVNVTLEKLLTIQSLKVRSFQKNGVYKRAILPTSTKIIRQTVRSLARKFVRLLINSYPRKIYNLIA